MRTAYLIASVLVLAAFPALAQDAPPPPLVIKPAVERPAVQERSTSPRAETRLQYGVPETWDDLPASLQRKFKPRLGKMVFQSVLDIETIQPPKGTNRFEPGKLLLVRKVRPAAGVRLTSAPRRDVYGTVGSVLWKAQNAQGEYWCLRGKLITGLPGPFYCYRDDNADGVFDHLYESPFPPNESQFQMKGLGYDENIKKPVSYEPASPPDFSEIIALRYKGVRAGSITANDKIAPGEVVFEVLAGRDTRSNLVMRTLHVELNFEGRGVLLLDDGQVVVIENVDVGGAADLTYYGAPQSGVGFVLPPATREGVVAQMQVILQLP